MGLQVLATCKCGLEKTISIGGGMRDFDTVDYFPCYCGTTLNYRKALNIIRLFEAVFVGLKHMLKLN